MVIDSHYKKKHLDHINDQVIMGVIRELDGNVFDVAASKGEFQYFKVEPIYFKNDPFRLIFLLFINEGTLGVINCFRVQRKRHE